MIKTISKPDYMSSKNDQEKINPERLSGFSLHPDADCPGNPEQHPPCEAAGQSKPPLKQLIETELRGIPLGTQVNVIYTLLAKLEREDASFKKKIYGNNFKYHSADCLYKNCFSSN